MNAWGLFPDDGWSPDRRPAQVFLADATRHTFIGTINAGCCQGDGDGQHRSAGTADLVIAATAEPRAPTPLHGDRDFERVAAVTGQALQWYGPEAGKRARTERPPVPRRAVPGQGRTSPEGRAFAKRLRAGRQPCGHPRSTGSARRPPSRAPPGSVTDGPGGRCPPAGGTCGPDRGGRRPVTGSAVLLGDGAVPRRPPPWPSGACRRTCGRGRAVRRAR